VVPGERAASCGAAHTRWRSAAAAIVLAVVAFPTGVRAAEIGGAPQVPVEVASTVLRRDSVGLVDPLSGRWHLRDAEGDVASFFFGNPGDVPFTGDWDCDGIDTPGLYRSGDGFVYLRDSNTQGVADREFFFGDPGDLPVAGDFDGDGCDTVAVFRPSRGTFYLIDRLGGSGRGLGVAERTVALGDPGDLPFAADLDGDGRDEVGVYRPGDATLYLPGGGAVPLGDPGDRLVAGDWSGSLRAQPALYRPGEERFYVFEEDGTVARTLDWGAPGWMPVACAFGDVAARSGSAATAAVPGSDPLGLVIAPESVRSDTLGEDRFAVWRCDLPGGSWSGSDVARILQGPVSAWFGAWSGGRYAPVFTVLGTLTATSRAGCLAASRDATPAGFDAALLVTDDELSGVATPGALCLATIGCSDDGYPGNGRVAMIGAATLAIAPATAVHEIGHTLHWPHSRSGVGSDQYDNPMDVMSGAVRGVIPGTIAFNRYQAGWIDPEDVAVYAGEPLEVVVAPPGTAGTQMVVIPSGVAGRFFTAGARVSGASDPVPATGVEVYLVDQTCGAAGGVVCIGAAGTRLQTPAAPDGTGHVLAPGASTVVGGAEITVLAREAGGFRVAVAPAGRVG
jgi:hypothetical protein